MRKGNYIVITGCEWSGSTTHSKLLTTSLRYPTKYVQFFDSPIKDVSKNTTDSVQMLLNDASNMRNLVRRDILPSLESGTTVISDGGPMSLMAYYCGVKGFKYGFVSQLLREVMNGVEVNSTIILHSPLDVVIDRITKHYRREWSKQELRELNRLHGAFKTYWTASYTTSEWGDLTGDIYSLSTDRAVNTVKSDVVELVREILDK